MVIMVATIAVNVTVSVVASGGFAGVELLTGERWVGWGAFTVSLMKPKRSRLLAGKGMQR